MQPRLIHLYWGNGKGKTTAAMGLALRALGNGWRVGIVQFLKGTPSGEITLLKQLGATVLRDPEGMKFVFQMTEEEKQQTYQTQNQRLQQAIQMALDGDLDLLVLDEVGSACQLSMLQEDTVRKFVQNKPQNLELVLTAHQPIPWMIDSADYVTEMACHKHPYEAGISARKGVEY